LERVIAPPERVSVVVFHHFYSSDSGWRTKVM
jgi:hypothetical protein